MSEEGSSKDQKQKPSGPDEDLGKADAPVETLHTSDFQVIEESLAEAGESGPELAEPKAKKGVRRSAPTGEVTAPRRLPPVPTRAVSADRAASQGAAAARAKPPQPDGRANSVSQPLPPLPTGDREAVTRPPDPLLEEAIEAVKACEAELASGPSEVRAARLHYEIARLCESPIGDLRRASTHYHQALALSKDHLPTIRGARRVMLARNSVQSALPLFDAEVRVTSDNAAKAALLCAKGRLLEDALGRRAEAREAYLAALELTPTDPSVLKALERWETADGAWRELAETYAKLANAVTEDDGHRAVLIVHRAHLLESREDDVEAAIELYETALALDPTAEGALDALKRLYHEQKRWRELTAVLTHEAEQTTDTAVAAMAFYRIGRVHAERLEDAQEAIKSLLRAVELLPDDALLLNELARLYEATDRHTELAETLERLASAVVDPNERLNLFHRLGQLHELDLEDHASAVTWYERALEDDPTFVPALRALSKHYREQKSWKAYIAMLLAESEASNDLDRKAAAEVKVAELYETQLESPMEAAEHYARALGYVPGHAISFKALARLYRTAGKFRELVELYERAIDVARTSDQAIDLLFKIAYVYEDTLNQHAQAAHAYRRILERSPQNMGAIQALQRASERAGRWPDVVEALELEARVTADQKRVVMLKHRACEVLHEQLDDRDAAVKGFREILDIDRTYVPALASLGRIYYALGRWDDLLETYQQQLEVTARGEEHVGLVHKMGELCEERLGREDDALGYYRKAIGLDSTYQPSLQRLVHKLQKRRDWTELVRVLQLQLKSLDTAEARAVTAYRLGEVCEEHLQQPDRAISAYVQALEEMPGYRPAFDALTRLRAGRAAWTRLVDDLAKEADRSRDPMHKVAALLRQGEVLSDALKDPKRAIACYEAVLELDPGHLRALLALEPLYAKVADWNALSTLYAKQAQVLKQKRTRVAALREVARIQQREGIGDAERRQRVLETILALEPEDPSALNELQQLALEQGDRSLMASIESRLAETAKDPALVADHRLRQAESLEAREADGALEAYRAALEAEPENIGAIRGLARVARRKGDAVALVEALRRESRLTLIPAHAAELLVASAYVRAESLDDPRGAVKDLERALERYPESVEAVDHLTAILKNAGDEARLADILSQAADSAKDAERVAALWGHVARLFADNLKNLPGAIGALNRVLSADADHLPTILQLAELYERDGQWRESARLLSRAIEISSDRDVLCEVNLELASIYNDHLKEPDRAMDTLKAVLALDADNREALLGLVDLQMERGNPDEAVSLARRLVSASKNRADRAAALWRLARCERSQGREATASEALKEAVVLEGPSGAAAGEYEQLIGEAGGWEHYVDALQKHLKLAAAENLPTDATYLALSRIYAGPLKKTRLAIDTLRRAMQYGADDPSLRTELALLLREDGRPEDAARELRRVLVSDPTEPDLWRAMAQSLGDLNRHEEARLALGPVAVFGTPSPEEVETLGKTSRSSRGPRPGSFAKTTLRRLHPEGATYAATEDLVGALGEAIGKVVPPQLERFGVTAKDRLTSREGHPIVDLANRLGEAFDTGLFDLYLHQKPEAGISIELTDPPSVLVPSDVARLPEAQQAFLLSRPLSYLARGAHPLYRMTPQELELLLVAAARSADSSFGFGLSGEEFLNQQSKRITKALPRKSRKVLEEAAQRYVRAPRTNFKEWVDVVDTTANRVALVLSDDLPACVDLLRATEPDLASLDAQQMYEQSPLVKDLLDFWFSDDALDLRRRSGLLPLATSVW